MLRSPVCLEEWIALDAVVASVDGSDNNDNAGAAQGGYSESDGGQAHGDGRNGLENAGLSPNDAGNAPISIMPLGVIDAPGFDWWANGFKYFNNIEFIEGGNDYGVIDSSLPFGSEPFLKIYSSTAIGGNLRNAGLWDVFLLESDMHVSFTCVEFSFLEIGFDYVDKGDNYEDGFILYFKDNPALYSSQLAGETITIQLNSSHANAFIPLTFTITFPGSGTDPQPPPAPDIPLPVPEPEPPPLEPIPVPPIEPMPAPDIALPESQMSGHEEWEWDDLSFTPDESEPRLEEIGLDDAEGDAPEVASAALDDASRQLGVLTTALGNLRDQSVDTLDSLREGTLETMRDILDRGDDLADTLGREIAMLREAAQNYANTAPELRDGILFEAIESGAFRIFTAGGEATAMASGLDAVAGLLRPADSVADADVEPGDGMPTPEALHDGFNVAFANAVHENALKNARLDQETIQSEAFNGRRGGLSLDL